MGKIENEPCPMCFKKTFTLVEDEQDIPYFGKVFLFSASCSDCHYKMSDVEAVDPKEPCKLEFTVENEKDLSVRIVRSSEAMIKIPTLRMSVEPGEGAEGFVSNVEGVLNRFKRILESERDSADDATARKKAKNLLKRLWKVETGDEQLKIVIEDPSGNSAIISEKTVISKLPKKKKKK